MTPNTAGSAGGRPSLAALAQLASLLGPPGGLIGSGYRAFMAKQPDYSGSYDLAPGPSSGGPSAATGFAPTAATGGANFDWPAAQTTRASAVQGAAARPVQLAFNGTTCTRCHGSAPPLPPAPAAPSLDLGDIGSRFEWIRDAAVPGLLPPPLGALVTAGRIAGALAGPQVSQFVPPRDPPLPPGAGAAGRNEPNVPKGCTVQANLDEERCNELPLPTSKASSNRRRLCWKSMNARYAHCITSGGEVGYPPLVTGRSAKRSPKRR
jgi:hypothetical protein